jgi:hypothetical protein
VKLFLDDHRDPNDYMPDQENWTWAKTAEEAISCLKTGFVEYATLDHDLTDEQMVRGGYEEKIYDDGVKSGYDVCLWLEENPQYWPPKGCKVHSANPAGRRRMQQVIDRHYFKPRIETA